MTADPFDPTDFRALGHRLIDLLAEHLEATGTRRDPVIRWQEPEAMLASVPPIDGRGGADPLAFAARLCRDGNHLHDPRFVGHQVSAPLPLAALLETVTTLLNNSTAIYEMGPITSMAEQRVLEWLGTRLGLPAGAGGVMTSGGSVGNLTALLAVRQLRARGDAWQQGSERATIFTSEQAHYCIDRTARILGLGAAGCEKIPVDAQFRMRPEALGAAIARCRAEGRQPLAVVASACTTATGTFDPLPELAAICREHRLWLHVDGAHGAPFALTARRRERLRGLELADSIVCDLHKMLQMPALSTAVLYRDGRHATAPFAQEASYLFTDTAEREWFNRGHRTLECTKRGFAAVAYGCLQVLGDRPFVAALDHMLDLAEHLADAVRAAPDFELAAPPDCNIVCFRHTPTGVTDLDALNRRIRATILRQGSFYLVQTTLPGGLFLRCTLLNPRTTTADLDTLLATIRIAAARPSDD